VASGRSLVKHDQPHNLIPLRKSAHLRTWKRRLKVIEMDKCTFAWAGQ
jgi:hypothetical protein